MNWMFKDRTRVYATHRGHALFPSNTNSPSSEAFSDMAIMSIAVQICTTPWSAKLWDAESLGHRTLGLITDGFDVAAQLKAWRGVPAATRGDARPKFDP
jgi:hypothetical protein